MKIAVFGGLGTICHEFILHAVVSDHHLSWFLHQNDRLPPEFNDITPPETNTSDFMQIVRGEDTTEDYRRTIRGCDAVFVAFDFKTSAGHGNDWGRLQRLIQTAMMLEDVDRLLVVTAHGASESRRILDWTTWFRFNVNQVQWMAGLGSVDVCWSALDSYTMQEDVVVNANLDVRPSGCWRLKWTIVRPVKLIPADPTGVYLTSHNHIYGGYISCSDVVDCSLKALEEDMDVGRSFSIAYSSRVA